MVLDSIITNAAAIYVCNVQNHQHAIIQIICNVSILGTVQGPQQKHEKEGEKLSNK